MHTPIYLLTLSLVLTLKTSIAVAADQSLADRLREKGVSLISLGGGGTIDEYPVWSPDGEEIQINVQGQWIAVDLNIAKLGTADWARRVIAVPSEDVRTRALSSSEAQTAQSQSKSFGRVVALSNGTTISTSEEGLGTVISVARSDGRQQKLAQTDMDGCHSPVPSPDERLFAFLCGEAGLFIGLTE